MFLSLKFSFRAQNWLAVQDLRRSEIHFWAPRCWTLVRHLIHSVYSTILVYMCPIYPCIVQHIYTSTTRRHRIHIAPNNLPAGLQKMKSHAHEESVRNPHFYNASNQCHTHQLSSCWCSSNHRHVVGNRCITCDNTSTHRRNPLHKLFASM